MKLGMHIVTCMSDYRRGFGLGIGFIVNFNMRLVTTLNYIAIVNLELATFRFIAIYIYIHFNSKCRKAKSQA
jgi:hypothetical protein